MKFWKILLSNLIVACSCVKEETVQQLYICDTDVENDGDHTGSHYPGNNRRTGYIIYTVSNTLQRCYLLITTIYCSYNAFGLVIPK